MSPDRRWAVAGALLLALALVPFATSGVLNNDELTSLSHAQRMLAGEWPYRDFFEFLPPVPLALLALVCAAGGVHLVTVHAAGAVVVGLAGLGTYALGRMLALGPALAWLPPFALVFCLFTAWPVWSHHWLALAFAVGAMGLAMRGFGRPGALAWVGAGAAVGLAGLTVQPDGVLLGAALAAAVALDAFQRRAPAREALARIGWLAVGMGAVAVLTGAALAAGGALGAAADLVVRWPLARYRQPGGINDLPFGADLPTALAPVTALPGWYGRAYVVLATFAVLPLAAAGGLAWLGGWLRARGAGWGLLQARLALLSCWCLAAVVLAARTGRSDLVHIAHFALPAVLWLTVAAARLAGLPLAAGAAAVRCLPLAALGAFVLAGLAGQAKAMAKEPDRWLHPGRAERQLAESPAIAYLRAHAHPGDRLVAMPYGGFFYVFGLPPATRYSLMLPPDLGYGSPEEFRAFWAEIAGRRPRFIVIAPWAWKPFELAVRDYADHLPPGYRKVATLESPQYRRVFPALVYERED